MPSPVSSLAVTLVDPYFGSSHSTALNRILLDLPLEVASCDLIVLRGMTLEEIRRSRVSPEELAAQLADKSGIAPRIAVLDHQSADVAGGEGFLPVLRCIPITGDDDGLADFGTPLRALELHSQLVHTGAIYAPKDMHFQLPSGVHADKYVRVADAFDDMTAVSRVADWVQHRLNPGTVLLSDTWTTLPLLQELDHRMVAAEAKRGTNRLAERILSFPQYPTLSQVRETLDRIPPLLTSEEHPKVLFLVSVVSSGELHMTMQQLAAEHLKGIIFDTIALVNAAGSVPGLDAHCEVEVRRYDTGRRPCSFCLDPSRSPVVLIDPRRYFPAIQSEHRAVMLSHPEAAKHQRFWEIASKTNAVAVHVDETSKGKSRHLHLAIRVERLLSDDDFVLQVRQQMRTFCSEADVVLIPSHPATEALRRLAVIAYPNAHVESIARASAMERGSMTFPTGAAREDLRGRLANARSVLILDDVAIHGETIKSLHRFVQSLSQEIATTGSPPNFRLRVFVVVARPERPAQWERLGQSLRQGTGERFLECFRLIPLPYGDCPWCAEAELLERVRLADNRVRGSTGGRERAIDAISRRLEYLHRGSPEDLPAMSSGLFLCDGIGRVGLRDADSLSPHSLFGEGLSESAAYGAVCAAVHSIRMATYSSSPIQGFSWYWDVIKIVTFYHDPILQASFLRAAKSEELLVPHVRELQATLREVMFDFGAPELRQSAVVAGEHALAAAMEKFGSRLQHGVIDDAISVAKSWQSDLLKVLEEIRRSI
jgi:hypothetical protein